MTHLDKVRDYVCDTVTNHCALPDRQGLYVHLCGVSAACVLLAVKRGLDAEIAAACGLMHDLYACRSGSYLVHGPSGAEMARVALRRMDCFSEEGQMLIRSAIYYHCDKKHVHGPYDELLKDADTLHPFLTEGGPQVPPRAQRLQRLAAELGIPFKPELLLATDEAPEPGFNRDALGDIAGKMAERHITGDTDDAAFQDILRYWPEKEAFEELKNAWCAAFVYHCCLLAGLELPIRLPGVGSRFAGVGAWLEWARLSGFYFDGADFQPGSGDIIIYKNVIPEGKKPVGSPWHDHIGVVLEARGDVLTVAEGNMGNDNVSGVTHRSRAACAGGFIRIPHGHRCDGWAYNYKTGKVRIAPFESI